MNNNMQDILKNYYAAGGKTLFETAEQLDERLRYTGGEKPPWYEKAVQLKTDNRHMSAVAIGRQVNVHAVTVLRWLAGVSSNGYIFNDNPPFTQKDFPNDSGRKYFDGAKPDWYEQAIALRKQGMPYIAIANELSTPEKPISQDVIRNWLIKGRKASSSGNLINPDAPFTPKVYNTTKIDIALLKELILDRYTDEEIIELIADEKGDKMASEVKNMLPVLRQKLNPGTQVLNKQTGDDLTGFVQSQ